MSEAAVQVAIVGAGPAGCFLADALGRQWPNGRIDIFERLPTPFGLVRGGVAPDHQGTKNISRQFERTLGKDTVRFLGNVEIGRDLSVAELQANYNIVVFATGAPEDRRLGIPGEDLDGVYGSGDFVGWYNGIPRPVPRAPTVSGSSVAIIGNGNVALDIARLLAKTPDELAKSDLCAPARAAFAAASLSDIWLIGRRGPLQASFSSVELGELGELHRAQILVDAADLAATPAADLPPDAAKTAAKNLDILRGYASRPAAADKPLRLHFLFHAAPTAIHGDMRAAQLELAATRDAANHASGHGGHFRIPAQTVISAIGYRTAALAGVPFDSQAGVIANQTGRVGPGIYATGWCRRGPRGVIPANRADALAVAELIVADHGAKPAATKPGATAIDRLLQARAVTVVDFAGWRRIDRAETDAGAASGRPREKIVDQTELLCAAASTSEG